MRYTASKIFFSLAFILGSLGIVSGNVIPVSTEPVIDQWIATVNQRIPSSAIQSQESSINSLSAYQSRSRENANNKLGSAHDGETQRFSSEKREKLTQHNIIQPSLHSLISGQSGKFAADSTIVPEPKPRMGNVFQEKLGFGMLSSLLPTSILSQPKPADSEHLVETESDGPNANGLSNSEFLRNPSIFQQHDESNTAYSSQSSDSSSYSENNSEEADSPGLFSRIRNVLPFSKGVLSGLMNNENNNIDDGESGYAGSSMSLLPSANYMAGETTNVNANPFSLFPSLPSLVNGGDNSNPEENSESGSSFFSSIPNPFKLLTNLLPSFNIDADQQQLDGGYDNAVDPGDSALTPLQSISDGGLSGVLGAVVPYLSHFLKAFSVAKAKLPLIKLLGAVATPILGAAIAGMVIGLVYVSFYVAVNAIQNEGVEGEMYLLSFQQLLNILGIPDPLEDLFGINFMRSLEKRSMYSRSLKQEKSMNNTAIDQCLERFACHAIGKRLMSKPSVRWGWIQEGIKWTSRNINAESWNDPQNNFYGNILRYGKSLIKAVSLGMEPYSLNHENNEATSNITGNSICAKYICDPIISLRNLVKK